MSFIKDLIRPASKDSNNQIIEVEYPDSQSDESSVINKPFIDLTVELTPEEEARRQTKWFKFAHFFYDGLDKHPEEKIFLFKLDFFLLTSAMLGYFIKTLNMSNISTAYVNGMSEYYEMNTTHQNSFNTMNTLWNVGYVIGQIPSNLMLHRISARYYLGILELIWATLTISMIACKDLPSMYAIRFLVGLTEAGFFPAVEYLIGSWYSPEELQKRESLFACSGVAASLVSGPLQEAVLRGIGKNKKYEAFQWLFVVDAIISFPVAIITIFSNPNTPSTTTAFYFTEREKLIGKERRRRIGAELNTRQPYTWAKIKSFFNTWHIYVFPLIFVAYNNCCKAYGQPTFTTWMKYDLHLPSSKYNIYPSIVSGVSIAATMAAAIITDIFKNKLNVHFTQAFFVMTLIGCALLAKWDIPIGLHWFCYFLIGIPGGWGQPQIFAWVNRLLRHDDMKRNFLVVCTNTLAYVFNAWVPNLAFNTKYQPRYYIGFVYTSALAAFGIMITAVGAYLTKRDEQREKKLLEDHDKNSEERVDV